MESDSPLEDSPEEPSRGLARARFASRGAGSLLQPHGKASARPASASGGRVRPDPVEDHLDIKRRQFEKQQKALERRRDQELQECSFSPAISHVSRELAESNPYRRSAPLHERKIGHVTHVYREESIVPKVEMNETSRVLAASMPGRDGTIGERAAREQQAFAERIRREAEAKREKEAEAVTYSPQVSKGSNKLITKRQGAPDALGRLTDEYVRKREEAREKARREAEDKMAKTLAKPIFVNKQSERLLQRAADAGREVKGIDAGSKTPRTLSSASNQRFDDNFSYGGAFTPRGGARSHSHGPSPAMTPRTSRGLQATNGARENSVSRTNSRSESPESPEPKPGSATPRGRRSGAEAASRARGSYLDEDANEDDNICAADPNLIGESGSDLKWLARMGKVGAEPRKGNAQLSQASSPTRSRSSGPGGFNPFGEIDKMRLEFQKLIKEKEDETMVLLEQIKAQKVEASNGNLKAENERLRDDLECHVDKIADLEITVQEQRESIQEMEDERDQLRKANEKLRLDLEAITEKGQAVVELNAKLTLQIKALKAKATKTKNSKGETSNADPSNAIREPSAADKVGSKEFSAFLNDSDSSIENAPH